MDEEETKQPTAKKAKTLTIKEQRFVKEYAPGDKTAKQALLNAGYNPGNSKSASDMASQLRLKPKIQAALSEELKESYPDLEGDCKNIIMQVLQDPGESALTKLRYMEFAGKIKGWFAPTKSANLQLSVKDKFKLPE